MPDLEEFFNFEPLSMKLLRGDFDEGIAGEYESHIVTSFSITVNYDVGSRMKVPRPKKIMVSSVFAVAKNPYQDYMESVYYHNDSVYVFWRSSNSPISMNPDNIMIVKNAPEELYHEFLRLLSVHRLRNEYTDFERSELLGLVL